MIKKLLSLFLKPRAKSSTPTSPDGKQEAAIVRPLKERVLAMRAIEVGRGGFGQAIVGESHYQSVLQRLKRDTAIAVGDSPVVTFLLAREPDNPMTVVRSPC